MAFSLSPEQMPIAPVPPGEPRPLWSVMIPTYNCADYLRETLASVLRQASGPDQMQIEVVDDGSTRDDPAAVVAELGQGRVAFFRQPRNGGHINNFNTCIARARGRLVHILHGDDLVRDGFYEALERGFAARPDVGAAFCRYIAMDAQGHWQVIGALEQPESGIATDWLAKIARGQRLQAPSIAVRREVYEQLGGFDRRIRYYGEDWEMWIRIATRYPVWYEVQPLAVYRLRASSLSGQTRRTGENMEDLRRVIEIAQTYLPADQSGAIQRDARCANALAALRRGGRALAERDVVTSFVQLAAAVKMSRAPAVLVRAGLLGAHLAVALLPISATAARRRLRAFGYAHEQRAAPGDPSEGRV
jgi:hypothetical protein